MGLDYCKESVKLLRGNWRAALELAFLPRVTQGVLGAVEWCLLLFLPRESVYMPLAAGVGLWLLWNMLWIPYETGLVRFYDRLCAGETEKAAAAFLFFQKPAHWLRAMGLGLLLGFRRLGRACLGLLIPFCLTAVPWYLSEYRAWETPQGVYGLVYGVLVLCWLLLGALLMLASEQQDYLCRYYFGTSKSVSIRGCIKRSHRRMRGQLWSLVKLKLFFSLRYLPWLLALAAVCAAPFFSSFGTFFLWLALGLAVAGIFLDVLVQPLYRCALGLFTAQVLEAARVMQLTREYALQTWDVPKRLSAPEEVQTEGTMVFTPRLLSMDGGGS